MKDKKNVVKWNFVFYLLEFLYTILVYNFSWDYFGSVVFEIYSKGFIWFLASYW